MKLNKRSIRKPVIAFFAMIVAFSCSSSSGDSGNGKVKGTINNGAGNLLVLEHLLPTAVNTVDSAYINEDGSYAFENVVVDEIGFYRVKQDDNHAILIVIDPSDDITLNSDWNLGNVPYTIEGSPESKRLQALNMKMNSMFNMRDSMNMVYQQNQGNEKLIMQMQDEMRIAGEKMMMWSKNFIMEDPSSFANLAAAEQINPDVDAETLKLVDAELGKKHGSSVYYQEFHKVVAKLDFLAEGSEVPDIILPNPKGEMVSLSSLRGKVVLIDFWASWCKPCRAENPNVVAAYNKYNEKGFEVFGVSLDQTHDRWVQAIESDGLNWTQVSDLKFWKSSVVQLYDIKGIPFAVLIDKEGKVIAKNLRGPALHQKLEEVLN